MLANQEENRTIKEQFSEKESELSRLKNIIASYKSLKVNSSGQGNQGVVNFRENSANSPKNVKKQFKHQKSHSITSFNERHNRKKYSSLEIVQRKLETIISMQSSTEISVKSTQEKVDQLLEEKNFLENQLEFVREEKQELFEQNVTLKTKIESVKVLLEQLAKGNINFEVNLNFSPFVQTQNLKHIDLIKILINCLKGDETQAIDQSLSFINSYSKNSHIENDSENENDLIQVQEAEKGQPFGYSENKKKNKINIKFNENYQLDNLISSGQQNQKLPQQNLQEIPQQFEKLNQITQKEIIFDSLEKPDVYNVEKKLQDIQEILNNIYSRVEETYRIAIKPKSHLKKLSNFTSSSRKGSEVKQLNSKIMVQDQLDFDELDQSTSFIGLTSNDLLSTQILSKIQIENQQKQMDAQFKTPLKREFKQSQTNSKNNSIINSPIVLGQQNFVKLQDFDQVQNQILLQNQIEKKKQVASNFPKQSLFQLNQKKPFAKIFNKMEWTPEKMMTCFNLGPYLQIPTSQKYLVESQSPKIRIIEKDENEDSQKPEQQNQCTKYQKIK